MSEEQMEIAADAPLPEAPNEIGNLLDELSGAGALTFPEVPNVKYCVRPAPTPDGHLAVMLRDFRGGYFLVTLNKECADCGGDGLDKSKGKRKDKLTEIPYCQMCVMADIRLFGRVWAARVTEQETEQKQQDQAEHADKKLEAKLTEARERVAKMEKQRDEALGQNVLDVEATKTLITTLKGDVDRLEAQRSEHMTLLKTRTEDFRREEKDARAEHAEKIRAADAALTEKLAEITHGRKTFMAEHCQRCDKNADDTAANGRKQTKAEEALDRYIAGPGKIAKRWEERIEPAKKTLERLEKQWKA